MGRRTVNTDRILQGVLVALLLVGTGNFLVTAVDLGVYPYDLDYSEGFVVEDVDRMLTTGQLYPTPSLENGFESVKYPPMLYLLYGGLSSVTGLSLVTGRALIVLAALVVVLMMGLITRRRTEQQYPVLPILFFAPFITLFTGITIRADMIALAFTMTGIYAYTAGRRYAAVAVLLAAFFTKQSFVSGFLAVIAAAGVAVDWAAVRDRMVEKRVLPTDELKPLLTMGGLYLGGLLAGMLLIQGLFGAFLQNVFFANIGGFAVRYDLLTWLSITFLPLVGLSLYYLYLHRDVLLGTYLFGATGMMLLQLLRGGAWVYTAIEMFAALVLCASLLYARTPSVRRHVSGAIILQLVIFFSAPIASGSVFDIATMDERNHAADQQIAAAVEGGSPPVYVEHIGYQLGSEQPSPEIWGFYEQYTQGAVTAAEVQSFFRQRNYSRIITYKRLALLPISRYLNTTYARVDTIERVDTLLHREQWEVYEWTG